MDMHALFQQALAVCDHKGLTGLLVQIYQVTLSVVVDHVHQRGVEHGLVLQRQVMPLLVSDLALCDVALDTEQHAGNMVLVSFQHRDVDLVGLLVVMAPDEQGLRHFLLDKDAREPLSQLFEILVVEEL